MGAVVNGAPSSRVTPNENRNVGTRHTSTIFLAESAPCTPLTSFTISPRGFANSAVRILNQKCQCRQIETVGIGHAKPFRRTLVGE